MRVEDLTVEVRDRTLNRVGQITPAYLDLKARTKWCAVGEWTVTLPGEHPMVSHLSQPGSGLLVTGPEGVIVHPPVGDEPPLREMVYGTLFSGPTRTPTRVRNQENPDGTYTFSGVTDEIVLAGALAFPDPSIADPQASSASRSNDTRTGGTESLMRQFVAYNVANGALAVSGATSWAPAGRLRGLRAKMRLQSVSGARGVSQQKSPRFQNLLELLQEMVAYDPALGFRVVQVGSVLEFQVIDSHDRTKFVRFDVENGTLMSEEVQASGPNLTDAIVAGQGEGTARTIIRRQSLDSIAAEEEWGVPFENFIDQRDIDVFAELQQSGDEALLEGAGGTAVKMVPADDTTMQVNVDWRQGDTVTTVVSGIETVARVTEVAYSATSTGVMAGAALGDVSGFTQKDAESSKVQSIDSRVSNLERAAAGPVAWDRITGEPDTFPSSWAGVTGKPSTFPPAAHTHSAADITSGTLAAARLPALALNVVGMVQMTAATAAPSGWLLCDGGAVSRTTYAALFAAIGTTYGAGNGSSTFNLPNLKGRVPVGLDASQVEFDVRGETGGAKTHTLSAAEMPQHTHGLRASGDEASGYSLGTGGDFTNRPLITGASAGTASTGPSGSTQAHNNLQPYLVLNYIIKT